MSLWSETRGYPQRTFFVCLIAYAFSQLDLALFAYAVPSMRADLGLSLQDMGVIVGASFALGGVLQVWAGHLTDRFGRKTMMQISLAGASVLVAAHSLAMNAGTLIALRAGAIFTGGGLYPATGAIVTEVAPPRYRGIMAGMLQTAYPMGWFLAAMFAAPFLTAFGWRALFLVALLSLPYVLVVRALLKESERFGNVKASTQTRSFKESLSLLLAPDMRQRTVTLFIAQFLYVMAYGGSSIFFPTYFVESRGLEIGSSAFLVGIGNGVGIIGYMLAAYVGEFVLTRRTTVVLWTLLGAACFLFLVWGTKSYTATIIAFAIMSIFFYGAAAVKFAYVAEIFPTHLRATGLAVCTSLAVNIGTAISPLLISTTVQHIGWDMAYTLVAGVPLVCAGLFYLLLKPIPSGLDVDQVQSLLSENQNNAQK
ncbi:MAG: MFS transporter [Rhodospirillaceae bacterium]|nr:MFS transporter [Rhodospirillaceae bacterium]